jgi:RNA polymerase sigma factor (sigma-70 family)
MMITDMIEVEIASDAELVSDSLKGDRDAFGKIVSRYQSLICSLAYSAIGRLGQSEDVAQETFITAWKHLRHLREPARLRSWLCGIARNRVNNFLRREGREPLRYAEELTALEHAPCAEPQPPERVITNEEEAILWRSLERIPETYREPLVLFYREGQSIQRVAESLELSEDAVKQRLSRGRKLLQDQVLSFVEGALARTSPGKIFTAAVIAALPVMPISAKAAAVGVAAAKAGATAKGVAAGGMVAAFLSFPLAIFGNYLGYRMSLDGAQSDPERAFVKNYYKKLLFVILGFFVAFGILVGYGRSMVSANPKLFSASMIGLATAYVLATFALGIWTMRMRKKLVRELSGGLRPARVKPSWEYKSRLELSGWPLVHIRVGRGLAGQPKAVKAWFAAGDMAVGLVFAFGGLAVAPFSFGGCAIGFLPFGGFAFGPLALGGFALGIWSFGGLAIGWQSYGGFALAWNAAMGGLAVAHDFALGAIANAAQVNNGAAEAVIKPAWFFRASEVAIRYLAWLNLLWVVPMLFWWRKMARERVKADTMS